MNAENVLKDLFNKVTLLSNQTSPLILGHKRYMMADLDLYIYIDLLEKEVSGHKHLGSFVAHTAMVPRKLFDEEREAIISKIREAIPDDILIDSLTRLLEAEKNKKC